jgi:hypothetical protein
VLALFAVAFGYVESAVVVYLRVVYDPLRASLHPEQPAGSLLPLITLDELRAADPGHVRRLGIELGRELATLVMLATVGLLARRWRGEWIAMFLIAFGVWDIAYYAGLKAMIGFPASLLTWDILFLIPVPWLGPVLAPILVSLTMIAAGVMVLAAVARGRPLQPTVRHWCVVLAGAGIIVASFTKDFGQVMAGEMPEHFSWPLFGAGLGLALLAFVHALRRAVVVPPAPA